MWVGKDGNINQPSLVHTMEGLSPFTVLNLNEDEVAQINDENDLLNCVSLVSIKDLKALRSKLKIYVPMEAEDCLLMLKRYTNVLFAIFSDTCPLFKCIKELILSLREYSRDTMKRVSLATRRSVLWITLFQSREFSISG